MYAKLKFAKTWHLIASRTPMTITGACGDVLKGKQWIERSNVASSEYVCRYCLIAVNDAVDDCLTC